jgi:hypothetical protein
MGQESIDYLKTYFQVERPGIEAEDLLFTSHGASKRPCSPKSISMIFAFIIRRFQAAGTLDYIRGPKRKPSELRLYDLRKFFRKHAYLAGFEVVEFWMGRKVRVDTDNHYRSRDVEFCRNLYADNAMPYLRINTPTPTEIDKTLSLQASEIQKVKEQNALLNMALERMQKEMDLIRRERKSSRD